MINKSQTVLFILVFILMGCATLTTEPEDEYNEMSQLELTTASSTSTVTETPVTTEFATTPHITITETSTATASPTISPSVTATPTQASLTSTPVMSETAPVAEISYQCTSSAPNQISVPNEEMEGLVLYRENSEEKGFVEILRRGEALRLDVPTENIGIPELSPDGQHIAFYGHGDSGFTLWVTNMAGTNASSYILEEVPLSRFTSPRWLDNSRIIIPLENNGDSFEWIIWSPDANEEHHLSLSLAGAGEEVEIYNIYPVLDPTQQLVVYPCYQCDGAEYRVMDTQSRSVAWDIDLGTHPTIAYRGLPIWSPNGEYLILEGGRSYSDNGLWVYDREGNLIYDSILPDVDGVLAASVFTWASDSQFVAFKRLKSSDLFGDANKTLAYLEVDSGIITDLCVDFSQGWPVWSPNGNLLAIHMVDQDEQQTYLKIIDIDTGYLIDFQDGSLFYVIGWVSGS